MKVRFVPSVDDYVFIAHKINKASQGSLLERYAYLFFLSLNIVVFPAYLIFTNHMVLGLALFVFNMAFYQILLAGMGTRLYRRHFNREMEKTADRFVEIELGPDGISRMHDENRSTIAWKNILGVEERPESIYFHYRHGAVAVRKAAFETGPDKDAFLETARSFRQASE